MRVIRIGSSIRSWWNKTCPCSTCGILKWPVFDTARADVVAAALVAAGIVETLFLVVVRDSAVVAANPVVHCVFRVVLQ